MNAKTAKAPTEQSAPREIPRYRLLEKSFLSGVRVKRGREWVPMDDVLLDPEAMPLASQLSGVHDGSAGLDDRVPLEIEYAGIPGAHMEPLNDAAKAMFRKHNVQTRHPIEELSMVVPGAAMTDLTERT